MKPITAVKLLFVVLSMMMVACTSDKPKFIVGISQCAGGGWRDRMNEEIRREAMLYPDITTTLRTNDNNSEIQSRQIDSLISMGVDLLIVSPNNAKDLVPAIERAKDAGIPVVLVDRKVESKCYDAYVGGNNRMVGEMAATFIARRAARDAHIFEVMGDMGITPVQERHAGFSAVMAAEGMAFQSTERVWNADRVKAFTDSIIENGIPCDYIYCHSDYMAIAVIHSIVKHGKGGEIHVVGTDALIEEGLEYVQDGSLDASVYYPTGGAEALKVAAHILHGEAYAKESILPPLVIDHRNAESFVLQDRQMREMSNDIDKLGAKLDDFLMQLDLQQTLLISSVTFVVILLIMLGFVIRAYIINVRMRKEVERVANSKVSFFTNVSHDFRTPLTLIADPLRQLKEVIPHDGYSSRLLSIAEKNVEVLLRLVNQMLDFRKFEEGKMKMRLTQFDLAESVSEWTDIFTPLAKSRRITYEVNCADGITMTADAEKIERLTYNILSNAFKYTHDGGHVSLDITADGTSHVIMTFADTGIGMTAEQLRHVFEDFYQANVHYSGTGIGLALVKAFVDMHHGTIDVQSTQGGGTKFIIRLPRIQQGELAVNTERSQVLDNLQRGAVLNAGNTTDDENSTENGTENASQQKTDGIILVIDDTAEVRDYIRMQMQGKFEVHEAADGESGIEMAQQLVPDLIILDVMMPGIGGIEAARRLKSELSTSHIPILMLTASTSDETKIKTYDSGADAYMSKPFSTQVLSARIHNLIKLNTARQQHIGERINISQPNTEVESVENVNISKADSKFIESLHAYMRSHLDDSTLRVDTLCTEFSLGHTQFYRKTKSLTGMGPNELLRILRLQRSIDLLDKTDLSVADITYAVGFTSPSYFTKCFREQYGVTPSEYRESITGHS